jgi:hypothetical protein
MWGSIGGTDQNDPTRAEIRVSRHHFETDYNPSDATFNAWRLAISQQARNLIHVVADVA